MTLRGLRRKEPLTSLISPEARSRRTGDEPDRLSLDRDRQGSSEALEFTSRRGREFVDAELDLHLLERSRELERHFRVVLIDDRRASILSDVETLVERE